MRLTPVGSLVIFYDGARPYTLKRLSPEPFSALYFVPLVEP